MSVHPSAPNQNTRTRPGAKCRLETSFEALNESHHLKVVNSLIHLLMNLVKMYKFFRSTALKMDHFLFISGLHIGDLTETKEQARLSNTVQFCPLVLESMGASESVCYLLWSGSSSRAVSGRGVFWPRRGYVSQSECSPRRRPAGSRLSSAL